PESIMRASVKPPRTNRVLISVLFATSPRLIASSSLRWVGSSVRSSSSVSSAITLPVHDADGHGEPPRTEPQDQRRPVRIPGIEPDRRGPGADFPDRESALAL